MIVAHNASRATRGTELGQRLAEIENKIEAAYGGDEPLAELPDEPETLVFGGTGEWVSDAIHRAGPAGGPASGPPHHPPLAYASGTGWLAGPRLLLTNHHVINAREAGEPAASDVEFKLQGKNAKA